MQIQFSAKKRDDQGTGASRRLRRTGRVPGILYGGTATPQMIDLDHNDLWQLLRKEAFYSSVLTIDVEGATEMCLLRDVQRHPYRLQVLHVDFQRIDATHVIHQKVPLHFINADIAPGVKLSGGIVSHVMNDIDVKCLPADLPSFIEVDLKDLTVGQSIHVSQLPLSKGVEIVHHGEGDPVVATITLKGGGTDQADEVQAASVVAPAAAAKPARKAERVDKR